MPSVQPLRWILVGLFILSAQPGFAGGEPRSNETGAADECVSVIKNEIRHDVQVRLLSALRRSYRGFVQLQVELNTVFIQLDPLTKLDSYNEYKSAVEYTLEVEMQDLISRLLVLQVSIEDMEIVLRDSITDLPGAQNLDLANIEDPFVLWINEAESIFRRAYKSAEAHPLFYARGLPRELAQAWEGLRQLAERLSHEDPTHFTQWYQSLRAEIYKTKNMAIDLVFPEQN